MYTNVKILLIQIEHSISHHSYSKNKHMGKKALHHLTTLLYHLTNSFIRKAEIIKKFNNFHNYITHTYTKIRKNTAANHAHSLKICGFVNIIIIMIFSSSCICICMFV